jgi:MtaA/CmuA family methyltransferase
VADKAAFAKLTLPDPYAGPRMSDRIHAVALLHERVGGELPVLGWVEGPIAEAADLRGMNEIMLDLVDDPPFARDLLAFCTEMETQFALAQVQAGADVIGIGDAAASLISAELYREFVLAGERQTARAVQQAGAKVRLHICGNTNHLVADMREVGAEQVELDWPVDLARAREALGPEPIMSGNADPVRVIQDGTPQQIKQACAACHAACGERYILAAGCEVAPGTPLENVRAMFEYARETT